MFAEFQRRDGKWYVAEGDESYAQITLLNQNKSFETKLNFRFIDFDTAKAMARLIAQEYDRGYVKGKEDSYYDYML